MNKRHYEHTLPNIRGSLSNTYDLITVLKNKRMIVQENGRKYTFKTDFHY